MTMNQPETHKKKTTFGDRASDFVSGFIGSWGFIIFLICFIVVWITINVVAVALRWDHYPFILLNLLLSILAAGQLPIILMSQNRMEDKDRRRAQMDFETDRKAEREIQDIKHELEEIKSLLQKK